jgi:streptogramin lyase
MKPDGTVIGEYTIPGANCGARAITAIPDGRLFFSAHDAGAIGEVIPRR